MFLPKQLFPSLNGEARQKATKTEICRMLDANNRLQEVYIYVKSGFNVFRLALN